MKGGLRLCEEIGKICMLFESNHIFMPPAFMAANDI